MDAVPYIWMDGRLVRWEDAHIHVLTHSLHYGSGVFEGIRFYETKKGPAVFRLKDHIERLFYSAGCLEMEVPYDLEDLRQAIFELIRANGISAGYIRPIVFYGYGKMGLNPKGAPLNVAIAVWPWGAYLGHDVVKVKVSHFIRIHPQSLVTDAKICGHYANSIMSSLEAHREGYDEALLLDYQGNVAEGPGENIFLVKNGMLCTPSLGTILGGITRDSVFTIARDMGISVLERKISLDDLRCADELFFTGTAAEITPIGQVDEVRIGDGTIGNITSKIRGSYLDIVHGKVSAYEKWLDYVS